MTMNININIRGTDAFTPALLRRSRIASRIYDSNIRQRVATDVQEALEIMLDEDVDTVRIKSEMPKPEDLLSKEDVLGDIQETIEQGIEDAAMQPLKGLTSMQGCIETSFVARPMLAPHENTGEAYPSTEPPLPMDASPQPDESPPPTNTGSSSGFPSGLAADLARKFQFLPNERTVEQAAMSAALYMNPATSKIAPHVKITWEPEVAETLLQLEKCSNPNRPFMVGVVGIPGSGKSTSADILAAYLGDERAIVMPMDGFHIPLAELAEFPNATDAIYRRGAPDTFHAADLEKNLKRIAYGTEDSVTIPGFDHAVGDPTPDQHTFDRKNHSIVLCEGLYLLHDDDGWEHMKSMFDWTIYIDCDVDTCIERLKTRNKCIPGYSPEEIEIRCDQVDRVNSITARDGAYKYASQIVKSGATSS